MRDELRRTFQSLIGFLNIAGAQNGQPQLDFQFSQQGERQLVTASYVPEAQEKESREARINFNFSPSVGFVEQRFVLSSAAALARELSQQAAPDVDQDGANTRARLDVAALRDVLQDNRSQLIAQNMLKEGNSKQEAEKQIDSLLHLMGWARDVTLRLGATDKLLQVDLQHNLADSQ
jgi:hypothetical protein